MPASIRPGAGLAGHIKPLRKRSHPCEAECQAAPGPRGWLSWAQQPAGIVRHDMAVLLLNRAPSTECGCVLMNMYASAHLCTHPPTERRKKTCPGPSMPTPAQTSRTSRIASGGILSERISSMFSRLIPPTALRACSQRGSTAVMTVRRAHTICTQRP